MLDMEHDNVTSSPADSAVSDAGVLDILIACAERLWYLLLIPALVGGLVLAGSFLLPPIFTARTVFLPPQQPQSAAAGALQSLGQLANLPGVSSTIKTPADQYVSLMQSVTVSDRIIASHKLMQVYGTESRVRARSLLAGQVKISVGKKDGLVTVEVDDTDPRRAADIANSYVDQLKRFTNELALTEAQQRRAFFEAQLNKTRDKLVLAQKAVQVSGINEGALRAEPRAAAEAYASIKAQVTAAEVRLQAMRAYMTELAPDFKQAQQNLAALRIQLVKAEESDDGAALSDYIGKYRDYKYQETLFELYAKQFELARLDESREGALIQVVDVATPPEYKSKPKRLILALIAIAGTGALMVLWIAGGVFVRQAAADAVSGGKLKQLRAALGFAR
jgi:uncharacterized protein involved in exopolysaccharide biosynthesis